jgi:hypothetical protein
MAWVHDWDLMHLWSVDARALRADPRFDGVVRRIGLVDYWKQYGYPDGCTAGPDDRTRSSAPRERRRVRAGAAALACQRWTQGPALAADRTPYRVWVSEIMLQQTQVGTVIGYYERFMARFPDVHASSARASRRGAAPCGRGLAITRGRAICSARRRSSCSDIAGEFPATLEEVMDLPGIGRSTAGADPRAVSRRAARDPRRQREARTGALFRDRRLSRRDGGRAAALGARLKNARRRHTSTRTRRRSWTWARRSARARTRVPVVSGQRGVHCAPRGQAARVAGGAPPQGATAPGRVGGVGASRQQGAARTPSPERHLGRTLGTARISDARARGPLVQRASCLARGCRTAG